MFRLGIKSTPDQANLATPALNFTNVFNLKVIWITDDFISYIQRLVTNLHRLDTNVDRFGQYTLK